MYLSKRYFVLEMVYRDLSTPMVHDDVEGGWINIFDDEGYPTYEDAEKAIVNHFSYLNEQHIKSQDYLAPEDVKYNFSVKPELVIIEKFGWN